MSPGPSPIPTTSVVPTTSVGVEVVGLLDGLAEVVARLGRLDLQALSVDEVAAGVIALQRLLDRGAVVLAGFVSAADSAAVWAGSGNKGIAGWLAERSKGGFGRAVELTKLADVLDASPEVARRVRDGEMSTATAVALAPTVLAPPVGATAADVEVLVDRCVDVDPKQARAVAEEWKADHDRIDEARLAARRFARRAVRFGFPVDGMVPISGQLPSFEAGQVRKALVAFGGGRPDADDTRSSEQRNADGLMRLVRDAALAERDRRRGGRPDSTAHSGPGGPDDPDGRGGPGGPSAVGGGGAPAGGTQAATLLVTVPVEVLTGESRGPGWDEFDVPVPGVVVREIAARAARGDVIPVAHDGTVVLAVGDTDGLNLGRRSRLRSTAQYLALVARDGHCRWPGCTVPASWCEVDHILAWRHGGTTDLANLWLLCASHHSEKHRAGTIVSGIANGPVTITLPNGTTITSAPSGPITRTVDVPDDGHRVRQPSCSASGGDRDPAREPGQSADHIHSATRSDRPTGAGPPAAA